MKQALLAVAGAIALCLCTVTANASPTLGQATGFNTAANPAGGARTIRLAGTFR
jgi:hypothetical protein